MKAGIKRWKRMRRCLCGVVLPLTMVVSMTAFAAETIPENVLVSSAVFDAKEISKSEQEPEKDETGNEENKAEDGREQTWKEVSEAEKESQGTKVLEESEENDGNEEKDNPESTSSENPNEAKNDDKTGEMETNDETGASQAGNKDSETETGDEDNEVEITDKNNESEEVDRGNALKPSENSGELDAADKSDGKVLVEKPSQEKPDEENLDNEKSEEKESAAPTDTDSKTDEEEIKKTAVLNDAERTSDRRNADSGNELPDVAAKKEGNYQVISFTGVSDYAEKITSLSVNDKKWEKVYSIYDSGTGRYYCDETNNELYFYSFFSPALKIGNILTIKANGYEELVLEVAKADDNVFELEVTEEEDDGNEEEITPPDSDKDKQKAPSFSAEKDGNYQVITISSEAEDYVGGIISLEVNEKEWNVASSKWSVYSGDYYGDTDENKLYFYAFFMGDLVVGDKIRITNPDYEDLMLTVVEADWDNFTVEKEESGIEPQPPAPEEEQKKVTQISARKTTGFDQYQIIAVLDAPGYVQGVTAVEVNGIGWRETSFTIALSGETYYRNKTDDELYFDGLSSGALKKGDILTIKHDDYEDLRVLVTEAGRDAFSVELYDKENPPVQDKLHIRLVGFFEAALTGQQEYDAVSGASTSISTNQNSNVTVQAAVLGEGEEPKEEDWKPLKFDSEIRINSDKSKSYVTIAPEGSGMVGVYSPYDGSLTLSGVPDKPGEYQISVTFTDDCGRTATSNELIFRIYEGTEKLYDMLMLENAVQTADGKYMYDMEPWAITVFGGEAETVTVPWEIKAWYGSHTSGTYGELGYAVEGEPEQTLIVPNGCNLTMVNMKIFSSVRIIVEAGGRLVLRDSSMHGKVEVNDGGRFSMNYDDYSGKFLTGASMNGQLILNDGAILENSSIYSNTNYLSNGQFIRHNTEPVVVVNGNVTVEGHVFVKGDEAPTGTDSLTGKSYSGQPGMKIEGGTLNIPQDSVVAVYGGGNSALTSVGGAALLLEDGEVSGEGRLIAVGGRGFGDDGGNAVRGTGKISVKNTWLEGGYTLMPKNSQITGGKAMDETVTLSLTTNRKLIDGERLNSSISGMGKDTYWDTITSVPDLSIYEIEANAPGEDIQPDPDDSNKDPDDGNKDPDDGNKEPDDENRDPDDGNKDSDDGNKEPGSNEENKDPGSNENNEDSGNHEESNYPDDSEIGENPGNDKDDETSDNGSSVSGSGSSSSGNSSSSGSSGGSSSAGRQNVNSEIAANTTTLLPEEVPLVAEGHSSECLENPTDVQSGMQEIVPVNGILSADYLQKAVLADSSGEDVPKVKKMLETKGQQTQEEKENADHAGEEQAQEEKISGQVNFSETEEIGTSIENSDEEYTSSQIEKIADEEIPLAAMNKSEKPVFPWVVLILLVAAGSVFLVMKQKKRKNA